MRLSDVDHLFNPSSVAVFGASDRDDSATACNTSTALSSTPTPDTLSILQESYPT